MVAETSRPGQPGQRAGDGGAGRQAEAGLVGGHRLGHLAPGGDPRHAAGAALEPGDEALDELIAHGDAGVGGPAGLEGGDGLGRQRAAAELAADLVEDGGAGGHGRDV